MQILGDLVASGTVSSGIWAVQRIVRNVLDYRLKRTVLNRVSDDQVVKVAQTFLVERRKTKN